MFNLGTLFVELTARNAAFNAALEDAQIRAKVSGAAIERAFTPHIGGLISQFAKLGAAITAAFAAFQVGRGISGFFTSGISEAAHLTETMNKVQVVFEETADKVTSQADRMVKAFGVSRRELLNAAASFGIYFQEAGKTKEQAADLANQFVKFAADIQSFQDIPFERALEKLHSGLAGQVRPLRDVGIFLSDAAVKAEALAQGFVKSSKEIDDSTKILARISLIQHSMAMQKMTGDIERTSDSVMNLLRKTGGMFVEFGSRIGQVMLPAVRQGILAFQELFRTIESAFERNRPQFQAFVNRIDVGFQYLAAMIRRWPTTLELIDVKFKEVSENAARWLGVIPENFLVIMGWLSEQIPTLFMKIGEEIAEAFPKIIDVMAQKVDDALMKMITLDWSNFGKGAKVAFGELPTLVRPALVSAKKELDALWKDLTADVEAHKKKVVGMGPIVAGVQPAPPIPPGLQVAQMTARFTEEAQARQMNNARAMARWEEAEAARRRIRVEELAKLPQAEWERQQATVRENARLMEEARLRQEVGAKTRADTEAAEWEKRAAWIANMGKAYGAEWSNQMMQALEKIRKKQEDDAKEVSKKVKEDWELREAKAKEIANIMESAAERRKAIEAGKKEVSFETSGLSEFYYKLRAQIIGGTTKEDKLAENTRKLEEHKNALDLNTEALKNGLIAIMG